MSLAKIGKKVTPIVPFRLKAVNGEMSDCQSIQNWYDVEAPTYYQSRFTSKIGIYQDQIIKNRLLRYLQPSTILELGVGTGRHAIFLAKHGFRVSGIDLSLNMLNQCKMKVDQNNVDIALYQMDAEELNFPSTSFDSIYCDRTFKFFINAEKVLKDCYSILRANGRLILILVNIDVAIHRSTNQRLVWTKIRRALRRDNSDRVLWTEGSGLSGIAYSVAELRRMLNGVGFQVLRVEHLFNFPTRYVRWASNLMLKGIRFCDERWNLGSPFTTKLLVVALK